MFDGGAVLPTAENVNVAGFLLGSFKPLKENNLKGNNLKGIHYKFK